jgi:hypothetical protein
MSVTIEPAGPPKGLSRFIAIADLAPGHRVRLEGRRVVVTKVERSTDGHHWRVYTHGTDCYVVLPPTARLTRAIN